MTDYTPTINEVRADYVRDHTHAFDSYQAGRSLTSEQEVWGSHFDAALAAHDAEVARNAAVNALREAADECPPRTTMSTLTVRKHLRDRADRIEREATDAR